MDLFLPIFAALEAAGVKYLVVGGLATILHGYVRITGDVDLIVHLEPQNCLKAMKAITDLGFRPRAPINPNDFAEPAIRRKWIEEKGLTVLSFYRFDPLPIDLDVFVQEPVDFNELWSKRVSKTVKGITINVVDKGNLIAMKRALGRRQDLDDVEHLEQIDG